MARPIEPTPVLYGEAAERLWRDLEKGCSPEESERRQRVAEQVMANMRAKRGIFAERAAEKQASRDEDARRLAAGEVTRDELRRENGAFAFPSVEIDFSRVGSG